MVSVTDASCDYDDGTPQCWFVVTARYPSGEEVARKLFSQFGRDENGNLVEVIELVIER